MLSLTCLIARAPSLSTVSSAKWTPNSENYEVKLNFDQQVSPIWQTMRSYKKGRDAAHVK